MTRKLLMHVGPVTIDYDVLVAGLRGDTGFTSQEFIDAMSFSLKYLRRLMGADETYQPFIIPGGGTSAMESVASVLRRGDKVLVVSNGVFGDRWKAIFNRYPVAVDIIKANPGEYVKPEEVEEKVSEEKYTLVAMTHVETSTGVREPIQEVTKRIRDKVELIAVDGVSSVGAETVKAKDYQVDIYLTASQKAIGVPPGAGLLVLSERAVSRLSDESVAGYYLNLKNWIDVMRNLEEGKGSYFATLPVHLIFMLSKAFELMEKEGLENRIKRHEKVAKGIRAGIESMGLDIVAKRPEAYSNTVTGVLLKKANAGDVLREVISEGLELAPGVHPALAGKYFRIGHMGWVNPNDVITTIAVLERVLKRLGEPVNVGEGVRAVQLTYS
ncbi:pyridoxal-phosphate-dependent aminotransferase family protein [Metallosphaera sedula]|uniref:pyridoxal-phosphate-dependent aminotransferase family protein n=1 Tax=Metallosphaera sedula TaxID=43687 RepID=UPI0020C00485|nr:alanine--glyoxylate aminotransferase family protein [Metallosphaera sedula]BBL46847.1 2-aminoethylphosphonate--pyruvate transaminase [Metallosphaera sedula]